MQVPAMQCNTNNDKLGLSRLISDMIEEFGIEFHRISPHMVKKSFIEK
ncbi:2567_t:CDS:1, partial [Dentiscutata heterogama]